MKKDNNEEEKSSGVSLEDYIIQDKINAFIQHYKPAKDESTCDEVYTDAKLRLQSMALHFRRPTVNLH